MLPASSIAMTTYNGEKYLRRQLDSLAEQTVLPDELVVCDDGSTDKTLELLHQFAETSPFPVRIFQNEKNLGVCANFYKAFSLCEKEVTFFCDQDDVWSPQKLEKVLKVMETKPEVGLVLTYDQQIDGNDKPLWKSIFSSTLTAALQKENNYQTLFQQNYLGWTAHNMACRTRWRDILFNKDLLPSCFDSWIFHTMGLQNQIYVLTEPCCFYRRHGGNVTSRSQGKKNPFVLLYRSIKLHQDIQRLYWKYQMWQEPVSFFQGNPSLFYPEIVTLYRERAEHLRARIEIIAHPWQRPWLLVKELSTGRYSRYSKGFRDVISDLITWPQKLPKGMMEKA